MISSLELRHVIESAFLPMKCVCKIEPDGSMFIQIFDQSTGKEELTVTGIDPSGLGSSRAIASLVTELKEDMRLRSLAPERRNKAHKA
ncbi:hypothetical protein ALP36_101483 [Pseudomonas syringae pv. coriandricola]|uniref:DUF1652 domain-containing protein n=1 Tax=Pseudomonas syringae pv. coriandricola TaxID=264453 RepID=A0A3M4TYS5_9PSED|nr:MULTISPECIES: DUF1652 domain-containing protein [Pseudomonas syringae group]MBI6795295.1 DUF1652 domain-containing protein [Pseudomonas syringae]RMR32272.1 hypothetical protein ALP87_101415 [Pseudomonas syringae pv. coriandricola]RMU00944.1 hypothetical protein ALP36_101483 [Pseudomonas syringae pv. coriandricola]